MNYAHTQSLMSYGSSLNSAVVSYPVQFSGGQAANQNATAPKQKPRSVELQYAEYMARNKNNSSFSGVVYVWTVNHWAALNPKLAERNAFLCRGIHRP